MCCPLVFKMFSSERADEWSGLCFSRVLLGVFLTVSSLTKSYHFQRPARITVWCLWCCDSTFDLQGFSPNAPNSAQALPTCSVWSAGAAFCTRDSWNNSSPHSELHETKLMLCHNHLSPAKEPIYYYVHRVRVEGQSVMWILIIFLHSFDHSRSQNTHTSNLCHRYLILTGNHALVFWSSFN